MGVTISQLQPEELYTFKKISTSIPLDQIAIPERPEKRKLTNKKWLIIVGVIILILLPFMIYTLINSDIKRITRGYDYCGNICGQKNKYVDGIECSGKDYTDNPYLQIEYYGTTCVKSCKIGYWPVNGICITKDQPSDASALSNLIDVTWQVIISCLLSILVAMGMIFLFRFATEYVVWGILIGSYLALVAFTIWVWTLQEATVLAIILTIVLLALGLAMFFFKKKIQLVILLIKESTTAIFHMPGLILIPLSCVIGIIIISFLFIITTIYVLSAGTLKYDETLGTYDYYGNPVVIFTGLYNFVVFILATQLFIGLQYMITAGAVAKWYFSMDKKFLESPILTSCIITFRYHLGTIALGSIIITIVQIIKCITYFLVATGEYRASVRNCTRSMERWFKFLSEYAYIETALHGQSFIRSGRRAVRLLVHNIGGIISVNYIGAFVLGMAKFLIILITMLISIGILKIAPGSESENVSYALGVVVFVAFLVAFVSLTVIETSISTIFICYCEDVVLNDGTNRPYYMSRNLMDFVQSGKAIYAQKSCLKSCSNSSNNV